MSKVWLIASGKGGVGKSTLTANLGIALSRMGRRVCIVDADVGLRDQDAILGLADRVVYDVLDVIDKKCTLKQALIQPEGCKTLRLLPAAQFARCKQLDCKGFARIITELKYSCDEVLIDCPAGIEKGLRAAMRSDADETVLVCTPDDVCIRNAERTAALLADRQLPRPRLIVNRLSSGLIRAGEMYSARVVSETLDLQLLGEVPEDQTVYRALLTHHNLLDLDSMASSAILRIARRMTGDDVPLPAYGTETVPWYKRLFNKKPAVLAEREVRCLDD